MIMSAAALIMSAGFAGGPALARAIASNSDKVDGLHAVKASATKAQAKGKLVATDPTTAIFPSKFIGNDVRFPAKVPVGVTLSGMWYFDTQSSGTSGDYGSVIDFGAQLPSTPTPVFSSTGASVAHCPGNYQAPAADPGYVCLYKVGGSGLNFNAMTAFSIGDRGLGFRFPNATTGADQDVFANGTWAVTTKATASPRSSADRGATK